MQEIAELHEMGSMGSGDAEVRDLIQEEEEFLRRELEAIEVSSNHRLPPATPSWGASPGGL